MDPSPATDHPASKLVSPAALVRVGALVAVASVALVLGLTQSAHAKDTEEPVLGGVIDRTVREVDGVVEGTESTVDKVTEPVSSAVRKATKPLRTSNTHGTSKSLSSKEKRASKSASQDERRSTNDESTRSDVPAADKGTTKQRTGIVPANGHETGVKAVTQIHGADDTEGPRTSQERTTTGSTVSSTLKSTLESLTGNAPRTTAKPDTTANSSGDRTTKDPDPAQDEQAAQPRTPDRNATKEDRPTTAESVGRVLAPVTSLTSEVAAPVLGEVAQPVVDEIAAPVLDEVVAPVTDEVIAPVTDEVVAPVVDSVAAPLVAEVAVPVLDDVSRTAGPVVDDVTSAVAPVTAAATDVVSPVVDTVAGTTSPVIHAVTDVASPVAAGTATLTTSVVRDILPDQSNGIDARDEVTTGVVIELTRPIAVDPTDELAAVSLVDLGDLTTRVGGLALTTLDLTGNSSTVSLDQVAPIDQIDQVGPGADDADRTTSVLAGAGGPTIGGDSTAPAGSSASASGGIAGAVGLSDAQQALRPIDLSERSALFNMNLPTGPTFGPGTSPD